MKLMGPGVLQCLEGVGKSLYLVIAPVLTMARNFTPYGLDNAAFVIDDQDSRDVGQICRSVSKTQVHLRSGKRLNARSYSNPYLAPGYQSVIAENARRVKDIERKL